MSLRDSATSGTTELNRYDGSFAWLYDHAFNDWMRLFGPHLRHYLEGRLEPGQTVLDLCCGTGETARYLLEGGWSVVGLDRSSDMLVIAAQKHAGAIMSGRLTLMCDDAESFALREPADLCLCVDGALNHMRDEGALARCFRSAAMALRQGSDFIFDLLEPSHFERWNGIRVDEGEDYLIVRQGEWDRKANRASLTISGGLGGMAFWRVRHRLWSRTFERSRVNDLLRDAGFEPRRCRLEDPRPTGRAFYEAFKI